MNEQILIDQDRQEHGILTTSEMQQFHVLIVNELLQAEQGTTAQDIVLAIKDKLFAIVEDKERLLNYLIGYFVGDFHNAVVQSTAIVGIGLDQVRFNYQESERYNQSGISVAWQLFCNVSGTRIPRHIADLLPTPPCCPSRNHFNNSYVEGYEQPQNENLEDLLRKFASLEERPNSPDPHYI